MGKVRDWLISEETGEPFNQCLCCRFPLVEIDAPWLVNKDFSGGECVLEYAICQPCRDRMTGQLAEPSRESVREFLKREIDWDLRLQEFMLAHHLYTRFAACVRCCRPRQDLDGYGITAAYDSGGALTEGLLPLLICHACVSDMTAGLGAEDWSVWRKFLAQYFSDSWSDGNFPGLF